MNKYLLIVAMLCVATGIGHAQGSSVYTMRPDDSEAHYFDLQGSGLMADGKTDVSDALQAAVNNLKKEKNFGILFIPEGKYLISKTIYIPPSIRLIGYGRKRPEIILADHAPGFDTPAEKVAGFFGWSDMTDCSYMFYFTGNLVEGDVQPRDANPGTFYSAMSNIDLRIGKGNPLAAALRTHYAQHCFISHIDIHAGSSFACLVDVGNEMEDVRFYGGQYGIHTMMCSPSWPMMITDVYFEGQSKACIRSYTGGLTLVNTYFKDAPVAYEIQEGVVDKMFMDRCSFENISDAALIISVEDRATNQINILNTECRNVPVLIKHRLTGATISGNGKDYLVKEYSYGLCSLSLEDLSEFREIVETEPLEKFSIGFKRILPDLPSMETWVNVKDFGAKGDGETDDTEAIKTAVESAENIYFPQGWYVVSSTIKMKENTKFIGLHPFGTQIKLKEATPFFSGFGGPLAVIESSKGGNNQYNGIGVNTGANNYRAVGIKWMAGTESYMNDVKFVGGHGNMHVGPRQGNDFGQLMAQVRGMSTPSEAIYDMGSDLAWDTQYWSLWITDQGGGTFKCLWTASTYSSNGLYINNTSTPSCIYAISLEHHVRSELRMNNVSNWKIYDIQTEEEGREGPECVAMELINCSNLLFANSFMMRVYRVKAPSPYSIRTWNCENIEFYNIHNYGQNKYVANTALYDVNTKRNAPSWEMARLTVTGNESMLGTPEKTGSVTEIAEGYKFAENLVSDSKGNIYFSDMPKKAIFKYNPGTDKLTLFCEFPWKPIGLAMDTEDNLLVVVDYMLQPGLNEEPVGSSGGIFGGFGTSRMVLSMSTSNPDNTTKEVPRVKLSAIPNPEIIWYPTNRHQWVNVEESIVTAPEDYFAAPDGKTYIADVSELSKCSSLSRAMPLATFFTTDENMRRILKVKVAANGTLSDPEEFASRGEYGWAIDHAGNLYIADGHIYVYNKDGKQIRVIEMPERPTSVLYSDDDDSELFVTSRNSFYRIEL